MAITFLINGDASLAEETRVLRTQFGDGYLLTQPDGLNSIRTNWSVTFDGLNLSEVNTLLAELRQAKGSGPVQWQSPLDTAPQNYRIGNWTVTAYSGQVYAVACPLELMIEP